MAGKRINFTGREFATVHRVGFVFTTLLQLASNAQANDVKLESVLKTLDPDARFEQVCDLEALRQISRDGKAYKPERTIVSALSTPKVTDAKWQAEVTDERLFNSIHNGKEKMPAFGKKLSDSQINALVAFVRTLKQ